VSTALAATRYVSLLGLGFGDCGKGLFTDHLCGALQAHAVVRFNGGAQAGHNVVLADGRHHTFSQFGAGSFHAGVATVLASPVVVHPTALRVEAAVLREAGVHDAFSRLLVDARCRVTTPFHQAAGRLREWARGQGAHGSCGVGVGETVRHALAAPDEVLRYGDLPYPARAFDKLKALRTALLHEFADTAFPRAMQRKNSLCSRTTRSRSAGSKPWRRACCNRRPPAPSASASALRGLAPWCSKARRACCSTNGAVFIRTRRGARSRPRRSRRCCATSASALVVVPDVRHLGVLRSYLTRHGAGPLPTHDRLLDARLAEPHNADEGWQGVFRRGHPDAVLLRYALDAVGALDGLVASHLDAVDGAGCAGARRIAARTVRASPRLPLSDAQDLDAPASAHAAVATARSRCTNPKPSPRRRSGSNASKR
jgi:adenylosuccinate synthase